MLFRLNYTVRELAIADESPLYFHFGGQREINVIVRQPNPEEVSQGHKTSHAFCIASGTFAPSKKNLAIFEKIERNEVWIDGSNIDWGRKYKGEGGDEITLPHLSDFPKHFQSFVKQTKNELSQVAKSIVSVLRWRGNKPGSYDPISTRGMAWSRDGSFWHPVPSTYFVRGVTISPVIINEDIQTQILDLATSLGREPVHHELYREAWLQRESNPRSSIIMGVSAAEISLKQCISQLIPEAEWLANNVPSPPLIKMIYEYLPKLPAINKFDGEVLTPPTNIIDTLRKGVTIRNQIAHVGQKPPGYETIESILLAIQDLLWLIDYYCGHEWALNYIRLETRLVMEKDKQ